MKHISTMAALALSLVMPLALLLGSTAIVAHPKLYKWIDEKGQVHYGQTRPMQYPAREVPTPPPPPAHTPDVNKPFIDQIREARDKAAKPKQEKTPNAELCKLAQSNLNALLYNARVRYENDEGVSVIMPEDVKQQKLQETQEQIDKYCK